MLKYQLSTGKTVLLTFDEWLNMDDEKEQELIAANSGMDVEDPFADFSTKERSIELPEVQLEELPEEIKQEIQKDMEEDI